MKRGCHSFTEQVFIAYLLYAMLHWVMGRRWRGEEANSLPAGALVLRRKTQEKMHKENVYQQVVTSAKEKGSRVSGRWPRSSLRHGSPST